MGRDAGALLAAEQTSARFGRHHFLDDLPGSVDSQTYQHVGHMTGWNMQFQFQQRELSDEIY
jgi:hypothetical protein